MSYTPSTTRASEFQGDLAVWLRENAETNNEQMSRLRRNLLKAIDEDLTPRQREVVSMHYFNGLSVAKIAEKLNVNRSTVSRTLARAEQNLRKMLKYAF